MLLSRLHFFFKIISFKITTVDNILNPTQARRSVWAYLGPDCLHTCRLSADDSYSVVCDIRVLYYNMGVSKL